ncbi:MAG: helix-turn-helix transcriptional regulator [Bacteroides sp.]|nr:helix-turn-helix transcriptional regulator [Bacteroides sp.]MCM1448281.1 helix-turn-helix transcriptional regulator [Bacteroides sp.]
MTYEQLAGELRSIRKANGLTLDDVSSKTGIHKTTLSLIENGKRNFSVESLLSIADAIGAEVSLGLHATTGYVTFRV